jgi:hypothetical protein
MSNNKQQTTVDVSELAFRFYPFSNAERNAFINGYNKAKEIDKNNKYKFAYEFCQAIMGGCPLTPEDYDLTHGGKK